MANEDGAGRARAAYPETEEAAIEQVRDAIKGIEYGSILIKIHQGEVVGIETSTKLRLKTPKG